MHNHKIIHRILEEAKKLGAKNSVEIEVGELSGFDAEEIKEELANHAGLNVIAKEEKGKINCVCSYMGPAKILDKGHGYCLFACPKCGKKPEIVEGGDVRIVGYE